MHLLITTALLVLSTLTSGMPNFRDERHLVPRRSADDARALCASKGNNGYQYNQTAVDPRINEPAELIVAGASVWQSPGGCCSACETFEGCITYQWAYDSYTRSTKCYLVLSNNPRENGPSPNEHCPKGRFAVPVPFTYTGNMGSPTVPPNPSIGVSCGYVVSGGPQDWDGYHTYVN
ncbi:MAG: hypothetical protein M1814_000878 [Vezdaea aestivalis]|nr:MAG: hypothetical protein M1814_000878 [Vezdaea aestivalis]